MKNKILGITISVICCALLLIFGSFLIMVLAPGVEIFGIRYVSAGTSRCEELVDFAQIRTDYGDFNHICVETKNVPVDINFIDYTSSTVEFRQNFVGLTKSKDKVANLGIEVKDGTLYITANEIEAFIYSQKSDSFYRFNLNLTSSFISSKTNLTVKSKTSSVTISGNGGFKNFTMESEGEFSVKDNATLNVANNLAIKTAKLVNLKENVTFGSCDITSTGNSINIANNVAGNIIANTNGGDLKFVACNDLKFTSTSGSIKAYGANANIVRGSIDAQTKGGSITISEIRGEIKNLTTSSGAINISKLDEGEISTVRGKIFVGAVNSLVVNSKSGNVQVKNVGTKIQVNGKNGKVVLGEGGTVANPTVSTTTGEIVVYGATGNVDLNSKSNNVKFENLSSRNIKLYSGKKLNAKNLMGSVEAYSRNNGNYVFGEVSGNVTITSGTRADDIVIDMTCAVYGSVDYSLKSTKSTKAKVYAGGEVVAESSSIESTKDPAHYLIKVETSYGAIVLKFSAK